MSKQNTIIVGAGLVGSLTAIVLAKRGYSVGIYERRADMRLTTVDAGRSINLALSTRGLAALVEVGLADIIREKAIPMNGRMMHDVAGNLSYLPYGKEGQFINSISRSDLNMILMDAAEKAGVRIHFNHRCTKVDAEQKSISFEFNGHAKNVSYELLLGTDGAYSAVRMALQFGGRFNFSQEYVEHGYKELHIPSKDAGYQLKPGALHIWPREAFMMIALPNPDKSFTGTLFFSFDELSKLKSKDKGKALFQETFADVLAMIPDFEQQWEQNPVSSLVTMKCLPWSDPGNNVLLLGDAAHAIVPFYGQGMNAGFEDVRILNQLLNKHNDNWNDTINEFEQLRKPDTDAIAKLALDNFIEMRDLVADKEFLLRKKIESKLHQLYPDKWIPLYSMVTFRDDIRYSEAYATGQKQKAIMDEVMASKGIFENWGSLDFEAIANKLHHA